MEREAISLDRQRCTRCGTCVAMMKDYCISEENGYPVFYHAICNTCQKCVAVCPSRAITVNGVYPERMAGPADCMPEQLIDLFSKRRSIKHFKDRDIAREGLNRILSVAKYAPNQNKNISIIAVDSPHLIAEIDKYSLRFVRMIYRFMFGFKPLTFLFKALYRDTHIIKRKMDYDLCISRRIVKENTQALIILTGNKHIAVTKSSAQYMLATMMYMAEAMGIGTCLMDSLLMTLNHTRALRRKLAISEDVLGVLSLGYSAENIVNIPRGYEVDIRWNLE